MKNRSKLIKDGGNTDSHVIYLMYRSIRMYDNPALLFAQVLAMELNKPVVIFFCYDKSIMKYSTRQKNFLAGAIDQLKMDLETKKFPLILFDNSEKMIELIKQIEPFAIVSDFSPLKEKKLFNEKLINQINTKIYEVDSNNIVPTWISSNKQEYAAYTFRPKIKKLLPDYLYEFDELNDNIEIPDDLRNILKEYDKPMKYKKDSDLIINPGEYYAHQTLKSFIDNKLDGYADFRNDPTKDFQSNLSPYIHFGQISPVRIALEVRENMANEASKDAFLEELIVRRELSDNYCYYNDNYDNPRGFPDWAKKTLNEHREDERKYLYTLDQLENAETHDKYWNLAQREMIKTGKMHGYMRMYWAKKFLEWLASPEEAHNFALYLNDKYSIDGNDANGYVGVSWSIGGLHDRPWKRRPIFGMIRYMNDRGLERKFDMKKYVEKKSENV